MRTKGGERVPSMFQKKMELRVWRGEGRGWRVAGGVLGGGCWEERGGGVMVLLIPFLRFLNNQILQSSLLLI